MTPSEQFPSIASFTRDQLLFRQEEIKRSANGNYSNPVYGTDGKLISGLTDSALAELVAISRALRAKNSGPPKPKKAAGPRELEELA